MAKDDLTKKEQELVKALQKDKQVILDNLDDLKNIAKKLEKTLGKADVV